MVMNSLSMQGDKLWSTINTKGTEQVGSLKTELKLLIFKLVPKLFPPENESLYNRSTQTVYMYTLRIVETVFTLTFLWSPGNSPSDSKNFDSLWKIITFSRPDNICSRLSIFSTCAYGFVSVEVFVIVMTCFLIAVTYQKREGMTKLFSITSFLIKVLSTVFYLPIMTILLIIVKYWISDEVYVTEYNEKIESLPAALSILAIPGAFTLFIFAYVYNVLAYECRHHFFRLSLYSRSHSNVEILKLSFQTIAIILYVSILNDHQEILRTIVALKSLCLVYSYHKYRPFYSPHTNSAHIASHSTIASINLCLLFGYLSGDNSVSFILIILVVPFFISIVFYLSLNSMKTKQAYSFETCQSIFEFELSLRSKLLKQKKSEKVIELFSKTYNETNYGKNATLVLWLSNYCFYTMEDDSLARIKLGIELEDKGSLDTQYQISQLKAVVLSPERDFNEDIDFLNFRLKYEDLKKKDKELCTGLLNFLHRIESGTDLKDLIPLLADSIFAVSQEYTSLVVDYPNSSSLLNSYITFLENILNDKEKANELLRIKSAIDSQIRFGTISTISYFDEENGMMLISGSLSNFAIITYVNEKLCTIIKQPRETLIGNSISSYVPYPFNINHDFHMKRYLLYCTNPEIKLPLSLFLQNQTGFLIECLIQIKCTALDGFPFFLVLMKEQKAVRELAILNPSGLILNHSEGFPKVLGIPFKSIKEEMIDSYLENYSFAQMEINYPYILIKKGRKLAIVRSYRVVKKKRVDILFLIYEPNEILACQRGLYEKESEYFSNQKIKNEESLELNEGAGMVIEKEEGGDEVANEAVGEDICLKEQKNVSVQQRTTHLYNPLKSIASDSSLKQNSFSTNPKFFLVLRLIRRLKWILVLVVFTILSLQTAGSVVLTENYRILGIDEISDIAELAYYLADVAVVARGLQLNKDDIFKSSGYDKLATLQLKLEKGEDTLRGTIKQTKCDTSKIFPLTLEFDPKTSKLKQIELLSIVQNIIAHIRKILLSNDTLAYEYCEENSLLTSLRLVKSSELLRDCKIEDLKESTKSGIWILLFNGFLSIFFIFAFFYSWFKLKKNIETIWTMFYSLATKNAAILSERITERLLKIHRIIGDRSGELFYDQKKKASSNYSTFFRFSMYLVICIMMISSFYIIIFFYSIPSLENISNIQPSALYLSYYPQIQTTFLKFWVRERILELNVTQPFKTKIFFSSPEQEIDQIRSELQKSQKFFLNEEFLAMIQKSGDLSIIFNKNSVFEDEYGLLNNIIMYSYDLGPESDKQDFLNFEGHLEVYNKFMHTFLTTIKTHTKEYHNKSYELMLIYTLLYFFGELFLFLYIFLIQLNKEQNKVISIRRLGEFIPISS